MINRGTNLRFTAVQMTFICFLAFVSSLPVIPAQDTAGVPVFTVVPVKSTIKIAAKASVPIEGTFQKWDATFTVTSTAAESGTLDIKIPAASLNKRKLRGKDVLPVGKDP